MAQPLLTIAIQTFNRASYLDLCLSHLFAQTAEFGEEVEVFISDNCSEDGTPAIIEKYRSKGFRFTYSRNPENIGSTGNSIKCFGSAAGKYVLIFSDDDVIVEGGLKEILKVLRSGEYGVVSLSAYGFRDSYAPRRVQNCRTLVYADCRDFFSKIHVFVTYLSGNIINKGLVPADIRLDTFAGTNLPQLTWLLPAAMNAGQNAHIEGGLVAGKEDNSGGYRLGHVFGKVFDDIFSFFVARGAAPALFEAIKLKAVTDFFPSNICTARRNGRFEAEDYLISLRPVYGKYPLFWLFVAPVIKLPLPLAVLWRKGMSACLRLARLFVPEAGKPLAPGRPA